MLEIWQNDGEYAFLFTIVPISGAVSVIWNMLQNDESLYMREHIYLLNECITELLEACLLG